MLVTVAGVVPPDSSARIDPLSAARYRLQLTVSAALEIPGLLQLGLDHPSMLMAPYDAWFDELAVSTSPISCDE